MSKTSLLISTLKTRTDAFYSGCWSFVSLAAIATPLFAVADWVESAMAVKWRRWLTQHLLSSYYANRAYYQLKLRVAELDNPDQRICEDVQTFAGTSVALAVGLLRKVFMLVTFSGLLSTIAPHLVLFVLLYALLGTLVTTIGFGRGLMSRTYDVLHAEADLRFQLVRLREAAESVAFYRGEARERAASAALLAAAVRAAMRRIAFEAGLAVWVNGYGNLTILIPNLLMAPRYFRNEAKLGDITQVAFIFDRIEGALSFVINNLASLSSLAAETERLEELLAALAGAGEAAPPERRVLRQRLGPPAGPESADQPLLLVRDLCFATPDGQSCLARDLSFSLRRGEALLIMGPSGRGKSSLLRSIAGME